MERQRPGWPPYNGALCQRFCYHQRLSSRRTLLESYKEEAIRSLRDVENANLKGLLRRVIGKIFNDAEIKGWCKEFEQKNLGGVALASA